MRALALYVVAVLLIHGAGMLLGGKAVLHHQADPESTGFSAPIFMRIVESDWLTIFVAIVMSSIGYVALRLGQQEVRRVVTRAF